MEVENARLKEAQERHKESLKTQRRDASNHASIADAEEAYRLASEELLLQKDKVTLIEDYFAQIERVLQGKPAKPQVSTTSTGYGICQIYCTVSLL
jgi:hypothetical protein